MIDIATFLLSVGRVVPGFWRANLDVGGEVRRRRDRVVAEITSAW
jgi:hypothetical protein